MNAKHIVAIAIMLVSLAGCKVGNVTHSGGVDNSAYLQFIQGSTEYKQGVEVYVDSNPVFTATVNQIGKLKVRGNVYVVKDGKHHVKVVHNGETLYEKDIIVSTQETKQITLP